MSPADLLTALPAGTRVVVRYRIESGFTDALGPLTSVGTDECVVDTKRGAVTVPLADVVLAKPVPPPPARR
ncbi:ferrous iron transport protein A [Amycolatopsis minnesotensis]|uniref:Histone acetyltransferase Rv0428c-like SH3 domain-containing protein n=1 Tax=Amycolatopsis minnesotensis TaxID=337894 RepID=A0ABP5CYQ6_9PSEU